MLINFDPCFSKARSANAVGQQSVAMEASRKAKMLNIIGLVCGIILIIIVIALKAVAHWSCLVLSADVWNLRPCSAVSCPSSPPRSTYTIGNSSVCVCVGMCVCTHTGCSQMFMCLCILLDQARVNRSQRMSLSCMACYHMSKNICNLYE